MAKFKDSTDREHELVITIHTLRELKKSELAFDLPRLLVAGSDELKRVTEDPVLICDVVYFISQHDKPEADRIDGTSFYKALAGESLARATSALFEAIADFSPSPDERAFLRDLKVKSEGVVEAKYKQARERLAKIDLTNLSDSPPTTSESPTSRSPPSASPSSSAASSDSAPSNSAP